MLYILFVQYQLWVFRPLGNGEAANSVQHSRIDRITAHRHPDIEGGKNVRAYVNVCGDHPINVNVFGGTRKMFAVENVFGHTENVFGGIINKCLGAKFVFEDIFIM